MATGVSQKITKTAKTYVNLIDVYKSQASEFINCCRTRPGQMCVCKNFAASQLCMRVSYQVL